ncbi:MAG TPA: PIG-L family deacetylase [Chitinophagaceae bacterium]|nr:PIG-L family deacetylase [Chitinophagaceae bacterium]
MRKIFLVAVYALLFIPSAFSQSPPAWTSADMYLAIRKLNVLGSVLYVAAHPDDENTRLIAYFAKDRMVRAGYLSMTRGDGGQNLIGDEQGVELGLIRTQELMAARRVDGGEQFFTRAFDFGYSKSPAETFTKWDKEKILSDVVWVIRKFQPDVIITRFPTTGEGGHGHHTASAILANEAFTAAADPTRFPEQLKYVQPWQAKRILFNSFNFGNVNLTGDNQFKFDVGGYNPLLGKSYGEIAAISRSNHKSQGFGSAGSRGEALEYFRTTGGSAPDGDILDGVDLSWRRVTGGEAIEKIVDSLSSSFDLLHPEKSVPGLVRMYKAINLLPDGYWKNQKMKETLQLIEQCSGLFIDITTTEQYAVQTDSVRMNFVLNNRLGVNAQLKKVTIDAFDSLFNQPLLKNKNIFFSKTLLVPSSKPVTQPYWLMNRMEEGYFNVNDQQKIGQADVDPAYTVDVGVNIEGQDFHFARAVKYKFTDPVKGEIYWPLVVIPPYTLKIDPELDIQPFGGHYQKIFTSYKPNNPIVVSGSRMRGPRTDSFMLAKGGINTKEISMDIDPVTNPGTTNGIVDIEHHIIEISDTFFNKLTGAMLMDIRSIRYDHIPTVTYFKPAAVKIVNYTLKTYNKKIGYIIGAGDKVPEALEQMGYEVTLLTDKELSRNNLQQFDAIITGVRAYNTNEWMNKYYDKLMKYVNDGGNLIVQYNTSNNIGPVRAKMSPYNFNIGRLNRITDENAPVTLLKPNHPVFNFPNKITQDDFKGWIQERSIYHAVQWDTAKYETVIAMNDPGEKPEEGSLIIAKYGKGVFVYTGIVFFRELPAGVPGAYRLLANIIALNRKKGF